MSTTDFNNADLLKFIASQDWRYNPEKESFKLSLSFFDKDGFDEFIKTLQGFGFFPIVKTNSKKIVFMEEGNNQILRTLGNDFPLKSSSKFLQHQNWSYATVGNDSRDAYRVSLSRNDADNWDIRHALKTNGIDFKERYSESLGHNILQIDELESVKKVGEVLEQRRIDDLKNNFFVSSTKNQIANLPWQETLSHGDIPTYILNVPNEDIVRVKACLEWQGIQSRVNTVGEDSIIVVQGDDNLQKLSYILEGQEGGVVTAHLTERSASADPEFIFGAPLPPTQ